MAEKTEKRPEGGGGRPAAAAPAAPEKSGGLLTKLPVLLTGVMVIEAVVLFAGFKLLGGKPQHASGAELVAEGEHAGEKGAADKRKTVEVQVVEFKAPNKSNGRTFLYDVSIYVVTKAEFEQRVRDTFKDKGALIQDRIRTIIAESDPEKLGGGSEPGLETLRRQVKYQLDEIVGDGVIDEVLVPRCIPFRTDY
jgi:flagellar basal body-associated protein FliL